MNGWTPDRKARQAAAIHRWQPWKHSTGPRTPEGKAKTRFNGMKHGGRSAAMKQVGELLAQLREREREARRLIR